MSSTETLEEVAQHVLSARTIVERQRRLIAIRKADGQDTELAESLLAEFEKALAMFERELTEAQNPPPRSR